MIQNFCYLVNVKALKIEFKSFFALKEQVAHYCILNDLNPNGVWINNSDTVHFYEYWSIPRAKCYHQKLKLEDQECLTTVVKHAFNFYHTLFHDSWDAEGLAWRKILLYRHSLWKISQWQKLWCSKTEPTVCSKCIEK